MDERELLSKFVAESSGEAFAELVRRNADLVYSAARRQLGDSHLAEDVTQAVFVLLARKAASVKGLLAGWLINTTVYACRDARKLASRREFHEQQAAQMRSDQTQTAEEARWEGYAPALDEAMARLNREDREAVALRYLQSKNLKDVGKVLGVSEDAARKRVHRGLTRLRRLMSAKAVVPAVAVLAVHLAARASEAAPAQLVATIAAGGGAAGNATTIGLIAQKASNAMKLYQLKIAAMVLAAVGVTGAATGAGIILSAGHRQAGAIEATAAEPIPPATNPAVIAIAPAGDFVAESNVAGQVQLARWDVILDDAGAAAIKKIAKPIATESKVYEAMECGGAELRGTVAMAMAAGDLLTAARSLRFANPASFRVPNETRLWSGTTSNLSLRFNPSNRTAANASFDVTGDSNSHNDLFDRIPGDKLQIKLSHPDFRLDLSERTARGWRVGSSDLASIVCDIQLPAGNALIFIGELTGNTGVTVHHLVVWESFKATNNQASLFGFQTDEKWWCLNGPAKMRQWTEASIEWSTKATHGPTTQLSPQFEKQLDDGKLVRLIGLSRHSKWPFCWWDAMGKPVGGLSEFTGDPPQGLMVEVNVDGPPEELLVDKIWTPTPPNLGSRYSDFANWVFDANTQSIEVGVLVGPWKEIGRLGHNDEQTIADVTYRTEERGPRSFVIFHQTGILDADTYLVAVDNDGKEMPQIRTNQEIGFVRNTDSQDLSAPVAFITNPPAMIDLNQVKEFRLMQRKWQWVTFTGFASQPATQPRTVPPAIPSAEK
jgi:RNA polymerase sigma factor (sigma-70 family)